MSKVLGYSTPFYGHLVPMMGILLELRARGHETRLAIGPRAHMAQVPNFRGPRVRPVEEWAEELPAVNDLNAWLSEGMPPGSSGGNKRFPLGETAAEDCADLLAAEQPECVIVDMMLWGAMTAAEASRIPWVVLAHSNTILPSVGPRWFGPGTPPPTNLLDWLRQYDAGLMQRRRADQDVLGHFNSLRSAYGLPPLSRADDHQEAAAAIIACTAEPFEYPRVDWYPGLRFVGPVLWDPPGERPAWLDDLDDRPLVLVCTSSIAQADQRLVDAALDGLATDELQVVITSPTARGTRPVPPNCRVVGFAPHGYLLPRAICVVCHGGAGLTHKALAAGVPVVACPAGRDQFEIARRIDHAHAGIFVPPSEITPTRLREAVLAARQCGSGARRIADAFRRAGGAPAAAAVIEQAIANGPVAASPRLSGEAEEIRRLRRELDRVTRERDLLCRSLVQFATEHQASPAPSQAPVR